MGYNTVVVIEILVDFVDNAIRVQRVFVRIENWRPLCHPLCFYLCNARCVACVAAAFANLELFRKNDLGNQVAAKSEGLREMLTAVAELEAVGELRQLGFMVGIELEGDPNDGMGSKVCMRCRELGMIIRPLGNVVVFMPPLVSSSEELEIMTGIIRQAIVDVC